MEILLHPSETSMRIDAADMFCSGVVVTYEPKRYVQFRAFLTAMLLINLEASDSDLVSSVLYWGLHVVCVFYIII